MFGARFFKVIVVDICSEDFIVSHFTDKEVMIEEPLGKWKEEVSLIMFFNKLLDYRISCF